MADVSSGSQHTREKEDGREVTVLLTEETRLGLLGSSKASLYTLLLLGTRTIYPTVMSS